jgi:hypothetical protein
MRLRRTAKAPGKCAARTPAAAPDMPCKSDSDLHTANLSGTIRNPQGRGELSQKVVLDSTVARHARRRAAEHPAREGIVAPQ